MTVFACVLLHLQKPAKKEFAIKIKIAVKLCKAVFRKISLFFFGGICSTK